MGFVKDQLGRAKAGVAAHPPPNLTRQAPGQLDGISLDHQVNVQGRRAQKEVAHKAAYKVEGVAHLAGCLAGLLDHFQERGG